MSEWPPILDVYPHHARRVAEARGLRKLFYRLLPLPLHTWIPLRMELGATWVRWKTVLRPRQFRGAEELMVNLGCGFRGREGWVNVDIEKHEGVNCQYDCRRKLPFPDGSVRAIFCEHFLEHIDYTEEAPSLLAECHRVLAPGGVLRLIVPDAGSYLRAYGQEGWEALEALRSMDASHGDASFAFAYDTKMELINMVFRQGHQHKYAYDFETLAHLLAECRFREIERSRYGESRLPELCLDQERRAPESLYVEAVK